MITRHIFGPSFDLPTLRRGVPQRGGLCGANAVAVFSEV